METETVVALGALGAVSIYTAIVGRALSTYSRAKLDDLLEEKIPPNEREAVHARLERTLDLDETLVLTAYALRAVVHMVMAVLAYHLAGRMDHPWLWIGLVLFLVFAEVLPKALATAFAQGLVWHIGAVFRWSLTPFLPLGWSILATKRFINRALGREEPETEGEVLEDRLRSLVSEGESDGVIEEETQEIIESAFQMGETRVSEIMTPRTELFCIAADTPLHEAARMAHESGHSRIPVFEETRDNIIGLFYVKDLLAYWDPDQRNGVELRDVLRKPEYVPETCMVDDLLVMMRRSRTHIAIVTDEYGGTAGVVTVEDALEELVGEIHDEYDSSSTEPSFETLDEHTLVSDARVHLEDISEALGLELPTEGDIVTLGGFITSRLGRIPKEGETFIYQDVEVSVLEADERRVLRARLTRIQPDPSQRNGK